MGIGSISFWQQDQNFWNQAQSESQSSTASASLITDIGSLMTNKVKGLASIVNQEALTRTNNQLVAALKSAVAASNGTSTSSTSAPAAPPTPAPATGTGTVPLTAGTSLMTIGIPPAGTITVSDGTNTTTYTSTGTDTVGDLINAINASGPKNAQVNAYLGAGGHIVIEAQNTTATVSVGGLFASNIGFGGKNASFQPAVAGSSTSSGSSGSTASAVGAASTAAPVATSSTPAPKIFNSAYALQTAGTAATLLASAGSSRSSINLLA